LAICVEYQISRKDIFYPLIYTDEILDVSELLYNHIIEILYANLQEMEFKKEVKIYNIVSEEGVRYLSLLYFNYCCKNEKWKNENEYRIVFANPVVQKTAGILVDYLNLGTKPIKIYIGKICSNNTINKLEEESKIKNYEIIRMS
jgi:hypothetical protein